MERYLVEWAEDFGSADLRLALLAGVATEAMVRAEMDAAGAAASVRRRAEVDAAGAAEPMHTKWGGRGAGDWYDGR